MKFFMALSMKVKIIIIACTAAAAAAVAGTVIIMNSEEAYRVIKVFELNGSAVVTRENTGDIDAYAGMNLESGDTLSVEENSTLQISLDSDKYILLDGGTVLKLIAQGTEADSRTVIELQEGTILNEIKNSLSANSSYEVNTPKATMAVRGTVFTVTTRENPDGSYVTDLYTAEGVVSVQLLDENGVPKGEEVYVPKDGAVTIITDVNGKTGNPAGVDGNSYFVLRTDDGGYAECGEENAVYYPNEKNAAEAQTEQSVSSVTSDSETEKTTTSSSEPESEVTTAPAYEAVLSVSDVPAVTTVPTETEEPKPVIPSEIASSAETSAATATVPETTAASASKTQKTESTTVTTAEKTTAELTSSTTASAETIPFYPSTIPPAYPYPPIITSAPAVTAPPARPTESLTAASSETTSAESSETETSAAPTVHTVSFVAEDGSVISEAEFNTNEALGTLPPISDKKGYTGKWMSGGIEVTENTVISEDMNIRLEYTPMPVTVIIEGPVGTPDSSGTETILTFTVPYDGNLTDSGYTIEMISQAAYDHYSGTVSYDYSIRSINVLYPDYADAFDSTVIAGDAVVDGGGSLVCIIVCNFDVSY